jgi:hypothetical protein
MSVELNQHKTTTIPTLSVYTPNESTGDNLIFNNKFADCACTLMVDYRMSMISPVLISVLPSM